MTNDSKSGFNWFSISVVVIGLIIMATGVGAILGVSVAAIGFLIGKSGLLMSRGTGCIAAFLLGMILLVALVYGLIYLLF